MSAKSWERKSLGEIVSFEYGTALRRDNRSGEGFPVYGSSGEVGRHSQYLVPGPGIVVGRKGTVGATFWSSESFWPIDTTYYVVPKEQLDLRWFYWLLSFISLERLDASTGVPGLNRHDAYYLSIDVPPLLEQQRIAEILDTVDEAIRRTEELIAKLKQIKAGLLHDLLTRGLDEEGRLRDPVAHPEQFRETELGRLPAGWEIQQVGEIFDMQLGKMLSKAAKIGRSPFPYLANRNVQWDRVDLSDLSTMDFSDEERAKYSLREGDLLVCEGGEIGRTAIWRGEMENCYYQKAIHRLRPKDGHILPEFMLRYMHRAIHESYFIKLISQTSIAHLTQEKLELLSVPLPPMDEQQAIVEVFEAHDARIEAEDAYRDKLTKLKQGLMQDLLAGRIRTTDLALDEVQV